MSNTLSAIMGILQAEANASTLEHNAKQAEAQAGYEKYKSGVEARMQGAKDRHVQGLQRARFARAGISLETGSPLAVMIDSATQASMTRALIKNRGEANAVILKDQGNIADWQASQTRNMSYINLGVSIAADIAKYYTGGASGDTSQTQLNFQGMRTEREARSYNIPAIQESRD